MRVLVFGAGPLGSLMAARLHEAGHEVALLARGQRLDDLKNHGVVLEDEETGDREIAHVPVVETLGVEDVYDLVMVVMRKNQAETILPTLAANRHVPTVLFMMNNAEGSDRLVQAVGQERVLLGFPLPGGSREGHVVKYVPVNEKKTYTLPIGEVDGQVRDRTRAVAELLGSMRGYKVQIRGDMDAWLKYHAAVTILSLGPAVCAAGVDMQRLARTAVTVAREPCRTWRSRPPLVVLPFARSSSRRSSHFFRRCRGQPLACSGEPHPEDGRRTNADGATTSRPASACWKRAKSCER